MQLVTEKSVFVKYNYYHHIQYIRTILEQQCHQLTQDRTRLLHGF